MYKMQTTQKHQGQVFLMKMPIFTTDEHKFMQQATGCPVKWGNPCDLLINIMTKHKAGFVIEIQCKQC